MTLPDGSCDMVERPIFTIGSIVFKRGVDLRSATAKFLPDGFKASSARKSAPHLEFRRRRWRRTCRTWRTGAEHRWYGFEPQYSVAWNWAMHLDDGLPHLRIFIGALTAFAHELQGKIAVVRALVGNVPAAQIQLQELAELVEEMVRIGQPHFVAVDLSSILNDVVESARARPKWRGVTFDWCGSRIATIRGDSQMLGRAFRALVGNAADACVASGGGSVLVSVRGAQDFADVIVRQTSPLPPPETLCRLLEPDFSSSKRITRFGTGIPTACAVAHAHGGSLAADTIANAFVLRLSVGDFDEHRDASRMGWIGS
jgi:signal transduction histidine kinase